MNIVYQVYDFILELEKDVRFEFPPSFLFRSLLGKELKYLSCVLKNQKCQSCPLRTKCAYGFIFENPIDKENTILKGRSNSTPPYIFYAANSGKTINLSVTLVGTGNDYFPYFFLSMQRAGNAGILKDRIPYAVKSLKCKGKEILLVDGSLADLPRPENFNVPIDTEEELYDVAIEIQTPVRLKKEGKYTDSLSIADVITSAIRRLNMLSYFYGDKELIDNNNVYYHIMESKSELKWVDYRHYSSRQQKSMNLGGVIGHIEASIKMNKTVKSVLDGANIFNIGKSISFGLGKIKVAINRG